MIGVSDGSDIDLLEWRHERCHMYENTPCRVPGDLTMVETQFDFRPPREDSWNWITVELLLANGTLLAIEHLRQIDQDSPIWLEAGRVYTYSVYVRVGNFKGRGILRASIVLDDYQPCVFSEFEFE